MKHLLMLTTVIGLVAWLAYTKGVHESHCIRAGYTAYEILGWHRYCSKLENGTRSIQRLSEAAR